MNIKILYLLLIGLVLTLRLTDRSGSNANST